MIRFLFYLFIYLFYLTLQFVQLDIWLREDVWLSFRGKGILEMQIFEERVLVNKLWLGFFFIYLFI